MAVRVCLILVILSLSVGCMRRQCTPQPTVNHAIAPYEQFIARNIDWSSIRRVVLMPLANQTPYPHVGFELQSNLAAELQRAGRFEIVAAQREDAGALAQDVFASGQFDEMEVLRIAREYGADAVMFVNVTQYHPYARPRIGLNMLMVSPSEGIAIASISGLWDTRELSTSNQAQAYFRQTQNWPRSLLGTERVFDSPDVFQRFVCQQVAGSLSPSPDGSGIVNAVMPTEVILPTDGTMPSELEIPPSPPPAETP